MSVLQINNGGEPIGIIEYDTASDSLVIRGQNGRTVTIDSATAAAWAPPVGAAYIQFPSLNDPETLWPGTDWTLILNDDTQGLFFRTEGTDASYAEAFGGGVQGHAVQSHNHSYYRFTVRGHGYYDSFRHWMDGSSGYNTGSTGSNETRPRNLTIRIWRRDA